MTTPKICTRTGKVKYPSELDAELAVVNLHMINSRHRRRTYREEPVRAYCCEFCSQWHMTGQPKRSRARK